MGPLFVALGAFLLLAALLISGADIELALRGEATGALTWGPALFRWLLVFHGLLLTAYGAWRWRRRERRPFVFGWDIAGNVLLCLVTLFAIGLALRLFKLDSQLWYDEVLTLVEFARLPFGRIVTSFPNQNQHMLFTILARFSMNWFGESAWTLRLPAVMFGMGSIVALYPLARKLCGVGEALLACALMTFSYHHVWFSQNARGYTGLLFFSILSTWLWVEALEHRTWRWWIWYAFVLAIGMWTQMALAFVIAAQGILLMAEWLIQDRSFSLSKPVAAYCLSVSISLQLYALALPEFFRSAAGEVSMPSAWTNPLWLITEMLSGLRVGFIASAVLLGGGAFVLVGWWSILRRNRPAALLMLVSVGLCAATMLVLGHNLWPRFFFFATGFAFIVVIRGTMIVGQTLSSTRAGFVLAILLIAASAATIPRAYALPKQDFVGARQYVEENRQPGDAVITVGLAGLAYKAYYAPNWRQLSTKAEVSEVLHSQKRIWLVYTLPIQIQGFLPDIWKTVQDDFKAVRVFPGTLGGGEVYVCRERRERVE